MSDNSTVPIFEINDTSVEGLLTWSLFALMILLAGGMLYEILRRTSFMNRILYTRMSTMPNETPLFPSGFFGWISLSYHTKENWIIENIGLDAVMFLRFLLMGFYICLGALIFIFPVLTAVHYVAPNGGANERVIINPDIIVEISPITLNQFSIINVPSGSSIFYLHVVYAYLLTAGIFYLFLVGYKNFSTLASEYLKETTSLTKKNTPWRRGEICQLRSIMIQNIPYNLRSDTKLKEYIESLGIGEVESAILDRIAGSATVRISKARDNVLGKLERAYFDWGINIMKEKEKKLNLTFMQKAKTKLGLISSTADSVNLDAAVMWECRPKFSNMSKHLSPLNIKTMDKIEYYTDALHLFTAQLRQKRLIAIEPGLYKNINHKLCSSTGFVTFKTQRSAQIAAQTLLHLNSGSMFKVINAPAPQDVQWNSLGIPRWRRNLFRHTITALCFFICIFIAFPTFALASLLNTESLSKIPFLRNFLRQVTTNQRLKVFVETVIPQVIVGLLNYTIIPVTLQALSRGQGYISNSRVEISMMSKYFVFLFFNVFFVFTIAKAFWDLVATFIKQPLGFLDQLPTTLPAGGPFFINYIISNIIVFIFELCRPTIAIYVLVASTFFLKTPREIYSSSVQSSYLDYGWLYPQHVLSFIIIICYSLIAPIILIPGTMYFGISFLVYKNQLMFVYVKEWESYGRHWILAINRALVGVSVFQITLIGILILKEMIIAATLVSVLLPTTYAFYRYCRRTFDIRTKQVPLDQLPAIQVTTPMVDISPLESPTSTSNEDDRCIEGQKNSRRLSFMEDVVYTSEEYAEERYLTSYMNPIFSRVIQRPWIPERYAQLFSQIRVRRATLDITNSSPTSRIEKEDEKNQLDQVLQTDEPSHMGSQERLITKSVNI